MRREDTTVAKEVTSMKVGGKIPQWRPRLRWMNRWLRSDMKEHQIDQKLAQNRDMEKCSHVDRPLKRIRSVKVSTRRRNKSGYCVRSWRRWSHHWHGFCTDWRNLQVFGWEIAGRGTDGCREITTWEGNAGNASLRVCRKWLRHKRSPKLHQFWRWRTTTKKIL